MSAAYHFLVANGMYRYATAFLVSFTLGHVTGFFRAHAKIIDLLSTETAGGLKDVVDAIKEDRQ